jgi:hypothetical protein
MFAFFSDFISHRKTYLTGIPPLQALFRVLRRIDGPPRSYTTLMEVICFLKQLLVGLMVFKLEDIFTIIKQLGWKPETTFDDWFFGSFFPGVEITLDLQSDTVLSELAEFKDSGYTIVERNTIDLVTLAGEARFFETTDG